MRKHAGLICLVGYCLLSSLPWAFAKPAHGSQTPMPYSQSNLLSFFPQYCWLDSGSFAALNFLPKPATFSGEFGLYLYRLSLYSIEPVLLTRFQEAPLCWGLSPTDRWLVWSRLGNDLKPEGFAGRNLSTGQYVQWQLPEKKVSGAALFDRIVFLPHAEGWLGLESTSQKNLLYRFSYRSKRYVRKYVLSIPNHVISHPFFTKYRLLGLNKKNQPLLMAPVTDAKTLATTGLLVGEVSLKTGKVHLRRFPLPTNWLLQGEALSPNGKTLLLSLVEIGTAMHPQNWLCLLALDSGKLYSLYRFICRSAQDRIEWVSWLPNGHSVSYLRGGRVWVLSLGGTTAQIACSF